MNPIKLLGVILIVGGVLGLVYGGFTYTRETHDATIGALELKVQDRERISIPVWAGVGAIAFGGLFLFFGGRRS